MDNLGIAAPTCSASPLIEMNIIAVKSASSLPELPNGCRFKSSVSNDLDTSLPMAAKQIDQGRHRARHLVLSR